MSSHVICKTCIEDPNLFTKDERDLRCHHCFECGKFMKNDAVNLVYCSKCSMKKQSCVYCGK